MKVNYGTTNALNYSKTLYEWTLAALVTEGKVKISCDAQGNKTIVDIGGRDLAPSISYAKKKYLEALDFTKMQVSAGRKEWAQNGILNACFEIDEVMFPIALSEGILDLKDVTGKAMAGMSGLNIGVEG